MNLYQRFRRPLSYPLDNGRFSFLFSSFFSIFLLFGKKKGIQLCVRGKDFREKIRIYIQINDAFIICDMERVAGIEPASLAWKARGYSRRWLIIFNVSNSKPNMNFWFHSAPLWKIDVFPDLSIKEKNVENSYAV